MTLLDYFKFSHNNLMHTNKTGTEKCCVCFMPYACVMRKNGVKQEKKVEIM